MKETYDKICKFISDKYLAIILGILLMGLLIPVLYLSGVDRASGDDLGYGTYTHLAFVNTGSLIEVMKAFGYTLKRYYLGWQGTWFSIFLFSMQPEVFSEKAYFVVPFIMIILWGTGIYRLISEVFGRSLKLNKSSVTVVFLYFFILNLEFIPGSKSSVFWWNGCAHYLIPFAMCLFVMTWALCYLGDEKKSGLIWISIFAFLLGGSNYQASLLCLGALFFIMIYGLLNKRKASLFLILPMILETVGLLVSVLAPGNKARGGEDFGFSVGRFFETIFGAFKESVVFPIKIFSERPILLVLTGVLFVLLWSAFSKPDFEEDMKAEKHGKSIFILLFSYLVYVAMFMPELYAAVEVSQGVKNTNFQVLFLLLLVILSFGAKTLSKKKPLKRTVLFPALLLLVLMMIPFKGDMKSSLSFVSLEYIISGQAADYKAQMDLQTKLLLSDERDVVLPGINDIQGPLMCMPVTENAENWTNEVTASFYDKDSVVSIPRDEYLSLYGE